MSNIYNIEKFFIAYINYNVHKENDSEITSKAKNLYSEILNSNDDISIIKKYNDFKDKIS